MKTLIQRDWGGLGDIFVHRMIFEDVKRAYPGELTFACPPNFFEAVQDHPYLDNIINANLAEPEAYDLAFNTSTICSQRESKQFDIQRSDIWAGHCGVILDNHEMHFRNVKPVDLDPRTVLIAPCSAHDLKSLDPEQTTSLVNDLAEAGYLPKVIHTCPLAGRFETTFGLSIRQLINLVAGAKNVVTVDTAMFHLAGGLKVPNIVSLFATFPGEVVGRYYKHKYIQRRTIAEIRTEEILIELAK